MNGGHDIVELNGQTDSYDVPKSSSLVSKEEEPPYENVQRKTRRKPSSESSMMGNRLCQLKLKTGL